MKTYKILLIALSALMFTNCSDEDTTSYVADLNSEVVTFSNSFSSEYVLSKETKDNIADRFFWNEVTKITTNTYELQASIDSEFTDVISIGETDLNNQPVLVSQLLDMASKLNLDDDPTTTGADGNPNNSGIVYFRVKASIGNGGAGSDSILSEPQILNIRIVEEVLTSDECDSLHVLGSAITDSGWNFPGIEMICNTDVLKVKLKLQTGNFRFFTTVGDWGSGLDYSYYEDKGYTIDTKLENATAGDNFSFVGTAGIYTVTIDNLNKVIDLKASSSLWAVGGAVPGGWGFNDDTVELVENTPDIWSASITLSNNDIFRFFNTFGTWDTNNNFAYYTDQEFTIDDNFENDGSGDANFRFIGASGTYTLTINAIEKTIILN